MAAPTIESDELIDFGEVTITVMTTTDGDAYTVATDLRAGRMDERLIYPNGTIKPLDILNPTDPAMAAVGDYLVATYS